MPIGESELIINADGSIYHLNLLPEDVAPTVLVVGDPERVSRISQHFDTIEVKKQKREFLTHTGTYKGKRITVLSTGIGTDNIDIVINELDALVNIDLRTREIKTQKTILDIIRVGTSGGLREDIPVDSFVLTKYAIGMDSLLHFYDYDTHHLWELSRGFEQHLDAQQLRTTPYAFAADDTLCQRLSSDRIRSGITLTNPGFYGPQGRTIRLRHHLSNFQEKLTNFSFRDTPITNMEMESAGIYGLSKLLGHRAVSLNAILANRALGTFSKQPKATVDRLIQYCLDNLS